jgi:ribosomal protein S18 acetylase RimI-like enzyme
MGAAAVIRLRPSDAPRYVPLRREMLEDSPWAFGATLADDKGLDVATVARRLADPENAIFAIEGPRVDEQSEDAPRLIAAVGILRLKPAKFAHRARIWGVFVSPSHRGRGLGRLALEAALELGRSWPDVDFVDIGVSENSPEAQHLYESLGFRAWGRQPQVTQFGDVRYDEIYMALSLK